MLSIKIGTMFRFRKAYHRKFKYPPRARYRVVRAHDQPKGMERLGKSLTVYDTTQRIGADGKPDIIYCFSEAALLALGPKEIEWLDS